MSSAPVIISKEVNATPQAVWALVSDLPPYQTQTVGNETVAESTSQVTARSASVPFIAHGNQLNGYTVGGFINNLKNNSPTFFYTLIVTIRYQNWEHKQ